MQKDYDYIKDKFDSDEIAAPDSLSEDNILAMLKETSERAESPKDFAPARRAFKSRNAKWIAIAACLVLCVALAPRIYTSAIFAPSTASADGVPYTFSSKAEIERLLNKLDDSSPLDYFRLRSQDLYMTEESDAGSELGLASENAAVIPKTSGADDHSKTYLQVEGVDEADIVKVDGDYIYCVNYKKEVCVLKAENGRATKVASIGSEGVENYVDDIFLKGDKLISVGTSYEDDEASSSVVVYDIKDRSNPKVLSVFRQSGSIVSSRMVGSYVYLITTDYANKNYHILPRCTIDGSYTDMPINDISCFPEPIQSSYIIVSAVDIESGDSTKSKSKAIFGASDKVYCNDHNLYTALGDWNPDNGESITRIVRASLNGLDVKFDASVSVNGYIINQFALDESSGYFRIATTSERAGIDVNNLYIFDENLKEVGKVSGFARDESIKAVRFMGNKAYVITYEAIDPLFIIDLSDPVSPRIEGEVMIDGFSTMLVPIGASRLLGIGHATGDNGYGGQYASGLKLALFDISDPSVPKVLDSVEFKDMSSEAQSTHLALCANSDKGYFAIPYEIYDSNAIIIEDDVETEDDAGTEYNEIIENEYGVLIFGVDDTSSKIDIYDRHNLGEMQYLRSAFIGDYIYGISGTGTAKGFKFTK